MFELLNTKWGEPTFGTPSGTITWSEDIGGDLVLESGTTEDDIFAALNAAFDRWESVAAVDFQQVSSGGDIEIATDFLNAGRAPGDQYVVGLTTNFFFDAPTGLDTMSSARIDFDDEYVWDDDGVGGFYAVALHEIGHTIGLAHPLVEDRSEIMNATIFATDLGDGDTRGIQQLYGIDGDDVRASPLTSDGGGGGGGALGLLFGLIALLAGLFTGGAGAAVAMAAGRVAMDEDEEDDIADQVHVHDSECGHLNGVPHPVFVPNAFVDEVGLPMIDMSDRPNPCGCTGLCEHIRGETCDDGEDSFLV